MKVVHFCFIDYRYLHKDLLSNLLGLLGYTDQCLKTEVTLWCARAHCECTLHHLHMPNTIARTI